MMGVTARANALLVHICAYQDAHHGVSPAFAEMKEAVGCKSKNTIWRLLDALEERGRIRRIKYKQRAIEVLERPTARPPTMMAEPTLVDMRSRTEFEHLVWDSEEKTFRPLAPERNLE